MHTGGDDETDTLTCETHAALQPGISCTRTWLAELVADSKDAAASCLRSAPRRQSSRPRIE
eukprot:COSAG02_NODE_290_length_25531_cov_75.132392_6_plen_61_part_00